MKITLLNELLSGDQVSSDDGGTSVEDGLGTSSSDVEDLLLLDQLGPQQLLEGPHLQSRRTMRKRKFLREGSYFHKFDFTVTTFPDKTLMRLLSPSLASGSSFLLY